MMRNHHGGMLYTVHIIFFGEIYITMAMIFCIFPLAEYQSLAGGKPIYS